MKSPGSSPVETNRKLTEAIVAQHVQEIFSRLPMLAGFWLRPDFDLDELSISTWPGCTIDRDLYDLLLQSLVELAEMHPEAARVMRGRTFARTMH